MLAFLNGSINFKKMAFGLSISYLLGLSAGMLIGNHASNSPQIKTISVSWWILFTHNASVFLDLIIVGLLSRGFFGFLLLPIYGFTSGIPIGIASRLYGIIPTTASISTHGIFETAAIVLALIIGGMYSPTLVFRKSGNLNLRTKISANSRTVCFDAIKLSALGISMLFIAALLESFVSPHVLNALR